MDAGARPSARGHKASPKEASIHGAVLLSQPHSRGPVAARPRLGSHLDIHMSPTQPFAPHSS